MAEEPNGDQPGPATELANVQRIRQLQAAEEEVRRSREELSRKEHELSKRSEEVRRIADEAVKRQESLEEREA